METHDKREWTREEEEETQMQICDCRNFMQTNIFFELMNAVRIYSLKKKTYSQKLFSN